MTNKKGNYRIALRDPETGTVVHGRFIFDGPEDVHARDVIASLRKVFPKRELWMEDVEGKRVDVETVQST